MVRMPSRSASASEVYSIVPMCRTVLGASGRPFRVVLRDHAAAVPKPVDDPLDLRGREFVNASLAEMPDQIPGEVAITFEGLGRCGPAGVFFEPVPDVVREGRVLLGTVLCIDLFGSSLLCRSLPCHGIGKSSAGGARIGQNRS